MTHSFKAHYGKVIDVSADEYPYLGFLDGYLTVMFRTEEAAVSYAIRRPSNIVIPTPVDE